VVAVLLLLFAVAAQAQDAFEYEIAAYEAQPASAPGGIVFTGSSSIRLWTTLAGDFPAHRVLNRGFGGSELRDAGFARIDNAARNIDVRDGIAV
jgi:hypothetical protein